MSDQTKDWEIIDWASRFKVGEQADIPAPSKTVSALCRRIPELEARIDLAQDTPRQCCGNCAKP